MRALAVRWPDVPAVMSGSKDLFRRVIELPDLGDHEVHHIVPCPWTHKKWDVHAVNGGYIAQIPSPYRVGETVILSEEWSLVDGNITLRSDYENAGQSKNRKITWAPANLMPARISRQLLRITSLRVERLQTISAADVIRQGVWHSPSSPPSPGPLEGETAEVVDLEWLRNKFARAWDAEHDQRAGWELDPFVWRIEVTKNKHERKQAHG